MLRAKPLRRISDRQASFERDINRNRSSLLRRARYRCELSGITDEAMDVHHSFGRNALGPRWTNDPDCLVVLCRSVHRRITDAVTAADHTAREDAQHQVLDRLWQRLARSDRDGAEALRAPLLAMSTLRAALTLIEAIEKAEEGEA